MIFAFIIISFTWFSKNVCLLLLFQEQCQNKNDRVFALLPVSYGGYSRAFVGMI